MIFSLLFLPFAFALDLDFQGRAFDPRFDDPANLAPMRKIELNLKEIGDTTSAHLPDGTWSDRAWDHNRALMNERYTDTRFTKLGGWIERRAYADKNTVAEVLRLPAGPERDAEIAMLSPAEKYDVLMGTVTGGLADANRRSLNKDMNSQGRFPTWWGICDGSSAASLANQEPVMKVVVRSKVYGVDIPFYAPDIKGLISLLWSSYNAELKVPEIGRQCDDRGGGACADVNPTSFHAAIHHFIGLNNGYLIADVDSTRVVWNHPIQGYETYYFRPDKLPSNPSPSYQEAVLPVRNIGEDPRRSLRAPGTVYIVGVVTKMFYGENKKQHPTEGSVKRTVLTQELQYELELDANLNMIGGEWLSKKHPDLLWTIPRGYQPTTPGDISLGSNSWDGFATPNGWENAARASAQKMLPLKKVVDALIRRSVL